MTTNRNTLIALLAASTMLAPASALAQSQPAPAPASTTGQAPADDAAATDIVVTARFRTESIREVPIAITAVTGASLAERQLNNLQDISNTIPAVGFRGGASNKDRTVFIRGIGTITTSPGVEPSVSTVLDGVVLSRPGQSTLDLGEVERIEVLRGPQGTLFGKNASAGVINIVTRNPTDEFHAFGEAGITTDEEYRLKLGASGALVPGKVQVLLGGLYGKFDGNVTNTTNGDKINGYERYGARGKLVVTPSDDVKFTVIGDYLHSRDTVPTSVYASTTRTAFPTNIVSDSPALIAALAASGIVAGSANNRTNTDFDTDVRDDNFGGSLTAEAGFGDYHVTSITAYRKWINRQHQDYDSISGPATAAFPKGEDLGYVNSKQFSQELRLTSPKRGLIDYVIGAYYLRGQTDERYQRTMNFVTAPTQVTGVANYGVVDNNYAVFGEANINFTKAFRAIAGYRSTWDDLSFYHVRTSTNDPTNLGASSPAVDVSGIRGYHNATGSTSKRGDSYRLGLQYDLGALTQAYFTYSRGYKGPAYNVYFNMRSQNVGGVVVPLDENPLSPETSRSFEGGIKGETADRSFSYALAAYTTKFEGYQANFNDVVGNPPAQVSRLINAGTVRSQGVEADVTLRPTRGFTWDISAAYTDAKVINFNCPAGAPTSCNVNGQPLPYAPKVKIYQNAAYRFTVTDNWSLELQSDVAFSSKVQYSLSETPSTEQPAFAIWNASVAVIGRGSGWQLRAYVKNLTNTHYSNFLANGTFAGTVRYVPRDDRRYAGLLLRKDF